MKQVITNLCLLLLFSFSLRAQINAYAKLTSVSGTTLNLSNVNQSFHTFANGEKIIVIQMQDDVIGTNTADNSSFGNLASIGNAGKYEVATIASVAGLPSSITITGALLNTYYTGGNSSVQIVSFRQLGTPNYTTTANITALPWNGSIGGVIALQVTGTLTLAHSINASAAGFRGGTVSTNFYNPGIGCQPTVYRTSSTNHGFKGEGIYKVTDINFTNARAKILNGGGGGNHVNAGGAGGGNYTVGGDGGPGYACGGGPSGGIGGISLSSTIAVGRIFMGGGGGGGQQNDGVSTNGSNGGGIILLRANTLSTSCGSNVKISANGAAATNSGNDGAGGAGAGGSIVLQVNTFSAASGCPLTVEANGGHGGDCGSGVEHGGGGGGGQGAVFYSVTIPTTNVITTTLNGIGGLNFSGGPRAGNGGGSNNSGIFDNLYGPLPVTLLSFTGKRTATEIQLSWVTTSEVNNKKFNIQHSTDGKNFTIIGSVNGNGNTTGARNFSFTHKDPPVGKNFYRLQQVDINGITKFSNILVIYAGNSKTNFSIFPSITKGDFIVQLPDRTYTGIALVAISDLAGRIVYNQKHTIVNNQIAVLATGKLLPGAYVVRIETNKSVQSGKLLVQ